MSEADVQVIRDVNDAIAKGDPRSAAGLLHPDVVWEHNLGEGTPEEGVYEGRESVIRLFERVVETWEYIRPEPRSIEPLESGAYHVIGDLRAKHRTSDAEIGSTYEQQLDLRDGQLVKAWMKTGDLPA